MSPLSQSRPLLPLFEAIRNRLSYNAIRLALNDSREEWA